MPIPFACPECQRRFSVKDELAGKVAQCSGCGKKIRIPQANPQPQTKPVPVAARSSLDDILDDYEPATPPEPELDIPPEIAALLQVEIEAERKKKEKDGPPICPSCGNKYIGSTVVCVTCGFDTKSGESIPGRSAQQSVGTILFSWEGRIPRTVYWTYSILILFLYAILEMTLIFVWGTVFQVVPPESLLLGIQISIHISIHTVIYLMHISLQIKRWHDRDKSGLWVFLMLIPVIGHIWTFIETGCLRGTLGSNGYGPDPLGKRRTKKRGPATAQKKTA